MDPFRDILIFFVGMFFMLGLVAMFEFLVTKGPQLSSLYSKAQMVAEGFFTQS